MSDAVLKSLIEIIPQVVLAFIMLLTYLNSRKIHTLVNSQYGDSLLIGMVSAKNLALSHPDNENFKRLAEIAEMKYNQHQAKQGVVDGRKGAEW